LRLAMGTTPGAGDVVVAHPFFGPNFWPPFFTGYSLGYAWLKTGKKEGTHVAASPCPFRSSGGLLRYPSHRESGVLGLV
jgi:hypothetical protein